MVAEATAVTFMSSSSETRRRRSSTSRWVSTAAAKGPARPRIVATTGSCRSLRRRKPTVITPTTRERMRSGTVAKLWKPARREAAPLRLLEVLDLQELGAGPAQEAAEVAGGGDRDARERGQEIRGLAAEVAEEELVPLGVVQPDGDAVAGERLLDHRAAAGEELGEPRGGGGDLHELVAGPHRRERLGRGERRRHLGAEEPEGGDVGRREPGAHHGDGLVRGIAHPERDGPLQPGLADRPGDPVPGSPTMRAAAAGASSMNIAPSRQVQGTATDAAARRLAVEAGGAERGDDAARARGSARRACESPVLAEQDGGEPQLGEPAATRRRGRRPGWSRRWTRAPSRASPSSRSRWPVRADMSTNWSRSSSGPSGATCSSSGMVATAGRRHRDLVEGGLVLSPQALVAPAAHPAPLARGEEGVVGLPDQGLGREAHQRADGAVHVDDPVSPRTSIAATGSESSRSAGFTLPSRRRAAPASRPPGASPSPGRSTRRAG